MSVTDPVLSVQGVHLWRGETHVLRGVDLRVQYGEAVHLQGHNGAGKSSLLRVIAGLLWAEQGSIQWKGQSLSADSDEFFRNLVYLSHDNALKLDLTVSENLSCLLGMRQWVDPMLVSGVIQRLGLSGLNQRAVRELSAGQRRRVALARVFLSPGGLWLLDEPLTNLDAAGVATVCAFMEEHVDRGGSVLFTAHGEVSLNGRTRVVTLPSGTLERM